MLRFPDTHSACANGVKLVDVLTSSQFHVQPQIGINPLLGFNICRVCLVPQTAEESDDPRGSPFPTSYECRNEGWALLVLFS